MVCAHARSHRHKALETRCEDAPMTLNTAQACAAWFREEALPFARMYMGNGARVMMCTWHPTTPTSGRLHRRPTPIALPNNLPYAPVRFEFISPDSYPTGTIDHSDPMPEQAWHSAHARLALAQKRTRFLKPFPTTCTRCPKPWMCPTRSTTCTSCTKRATCPSSPARSA